MPAFGSALAVYVRLVVPLVVARLLDAHAPKGAVAVHAGALAPYQQ
jgi:hypothetical protein